MEEINHSTLTDLIEKLDKNQLYIIAIICILAGVAIGFILSPVTKGVHIVIGSNNSVKNSGDGILLSGVCKPRKEQESSKDGGKKK